MRPSFFVLYSAVATQAATALLLSCALYVLGRSYPRDFLRLWAGAWLAEAVHVGAGMLAVAVRALPQATGTSTADLVSWVSQTSGYLHSALLVMGAIALYRDQHFATPRRAWAIATGGAALLALVPTLAVPDDASPASVGIRIAVRLGLMSFITGVAALVAACIILRNRARAPQLGVRWASTILIVIGLHRFMGAAIAMTDFGSWAPYAIPVLQAMPLLDILLLAALGIGTAIAQVENEQSAIKAAAEGQLAAERRARASDASLVSALAAVPDLVAVIGADARLLAWNQSFEGFARRHGQVVAQEGMPVLDALTGEPRIEWGQRIEALLTGADQTFESEISGVDATPAFFDVSARPMRDADEIVGAVIVARDVTERRKLEQQLQQAQRLDTVGRLAGGIAHDFNNLLTAILSSASVARDILPTGHEVQADLSDIQLAGERATQLTRQLLAFARRQPVSQQPIDLNDRVSSMERMLSRLVGPNIALRVTLGDALWHIRADGPQLEQVLVNITVNARDAMPAGGRLTIRTGHRTIVDGAIMHPRPMPAGDYVEIVISDTGEGMDEETLAHVFEPFYTTKPVGQGTGLGLAMCYGIVRQHHGAIWIESSKGRGSTVVILLPRYEGPLPVVAERPRRDTPTSTARGTETILLVEDEPQVRAVAARAMRSAGYRVLEATNGRDGVQIARRERDGIDMIVSDVVMPEMGGKEMVDLARQFLPHVAVLFVSGYTAGSFPSPIGDASARNFLQKPFTPQELLDAIRHVLDRQAQVRAGEAASAIS